MKNQFYYTRKEQVGETPEYKEFEDSLNVDMVIRTRTMEDGRLLVLLSDIHERAGEVPEVNTKTNKVTYTRRRDTYQSEIYLTLEDAAKFKIVTQI